MAQQLQGYASLHHDYINVGYLGRRDCAVAHGTGRGPSMQELPQETVHEIEKKDIPFKHLNLTG